MEDSISLKLEVNPDVPPADWGETLDRLDGTIFQSAIWGEYQRSAVGARPYYVRARDESGAARAASVLMLQASRRPIVGALLRDLSMPAHPCIGDSGADLGAEFLRACETVARDLGCASIEIGSFMSGTSPLAPSILGYHESLRYEFVADLTRDRAELWRAMKQDQRERIRKLERSGLTVEVETDRAAMDVLREARETTQEKRARSGQGYELDDDPRFYNLLHEHLVRRNAARLFIARLEGRPVAGLFFSVFRKRAYSMFSGSTVEGYRMGAQSRVFWRAVEELQTEGVRELNRGGVPASSEREGDPLHGIHQFKLRLGTERRLCRSGRKVLSPIRAWAGRVVRRVGAVAGGNR